MCAASSRMVLSPHSALAIRTESHFPISQYRETSSVLTARHARSRAASIILTISSKAPILAKGALFFVMWLRPVTLFLLFIGLCMGGALQHGNYCSVKEFVE